MTAGLLAGAVLLAAGTAGANSSETWAVRAQAYTAGPYGEAWTLEVDSDGEKAALEIGYMLDPLGEMKGSFFVGAEPRAALRRAIESERFMALPTRIEPASAPFHQPSLTLEIRLGDRVHRVDVYDPDGFEDSPDVRRFLAIWEAAFAVVPLRPGW